MLLRLPPSLHYPITVTSLLKQPGDKVERDEALFWYVYQTTVTEGDGLGNKVDVKRKFPTKFESTVDGEVVQWKIEKGDVIDEPYVPTPRCRSFGSGVEMLIFWLGSMFWRLMSHVLMRSSLVGSVPFVGRI